ncbi:MAG: T9SS type A sorting domain-containing protein [Paludibacter sp.]|nr:T9SS type A sorting domain-containing protein [Paludibacter sp.]
MTKKTFIILSALLVFTSGYAQKNILNDSNFELPFAVNSFAENNKWIHVLNNDVVSGEIFRTKQFGFSDSILYSKVAYKVSDLNSRNNCQITQRVTGLKQKKYRLTFWAWISSRDIYYTAEVNFLNENYTNESGTRAAQIISQSVSSSSLNYHIPGNWKLQTLDFDLSQVEDINRLDVVRFSLFPNCNNGNTITRECEYYIAFPQLYEVTDSHKDYFVDGSFESWTIAGIEPVSNYWFANTGNNACVKRGAGHRDTDYAFTISTQNENDGTFIETLPGSLRIPRTNIDLSFYARSEDENGQMRILLGNKNLGTINLTSAWTRYKMNIDYADVPAELEDKLRFEILKGNTYGIDACRIERTDGLSEPDVPIEGNNKKMLITSNADSGNGSLRQAVIDASAGDTIIIPGDYEITLNAELNIAKSMVIDGQGATIKVNDPGVTKQKLIIIGNGSTDTEATSSEVTLKNITLKPGDITGTHATASNIANCGAGITLFNFSKLFAYNLNIDGGKGNYAGAIHVNHNSSTIKLYNSTFTNNQATSSNGGAAMLKGDALVDNCLFEGNLAKLNGSALATYGKASIKQSEFINNEAQGTVGGAIVNYSQTNGIVDIYGCLFDSNVCSNANGGGGAIAANHNQSTTLITNCTFTNNSGTSTGAVLFSTNSSVATAGGMTFINNTFAGNQASGTSPGALLIDNTKTIAYTFSILLINNIFAYNYNANGTQDVSALNTALYNLSGSNNITGNSVGLDVLVATIPFAYNQEPELFNAFETGEPRKPLKDPDGTIKLSGESSIAYGAGFTYGFYEPELIPGLDQLNVKRASIPCLGACEYVAVNGTGMPSINTAGISIYPNPTAGQIQIRGADKINRVSVIDLTGKIVYITDENRENVFLNQLQSGLYLILINTEQGTYTQRIQIKK